MERFRERLRLFAARRLDDPASAEDVAQETLSRVLDALRQDRVHTPAALPAFVFQTARNVCRQHHRSTGRERRAFHRFRHWREATVSRRDPLLQLVGHERRQRVRRALQRLGERDREILRMSYYEDVDTVDVARRLEITPGAVRVRRHRALKRLRGLLEEAGPAERRPSDDAGRAEA